MNSQMWLPLDLADSIRHIAVKEHRRYKDVLAEAVSMYLRVRYPNIKEDNNGRTNTGRNISSAQSKRI